VLPGVTDALKFIPTAAKPAGRAEVGALWQKESPQETGAKREYLVVKLLQRHYILCCSAVIIKTAVCHKRQIH
jgi:hypothetical protein